MAEGGDAAAMNRSVPMSKALDDCMSEPAHRTAWTHAGFDSPA